MKITLLEFFVGDSIISRAQAKRIIACFGNSKEVTLDFEGVTFIGQAFADEIFRVFQNSSPGCNLKVMNTNESVDRIIKHVIA